MYAVKTFSHGLHYDDLGATGAIEDVYETAALQQLPDPVKSDILPLPPMDTWTNIRTLGASVTASPTTPQPCESHRRPPHDLFSVGAISRHGHDRAKARYSFDRLATQRHPHPPRRRHRRVSGRRQSKATPRNSQGRNEHRHRHRPLYQRHQSARRRREMDGRHKFHDERRPLSRRPRHSRPQTTPPADASNNWKLIYNNTHTADPDSKRRWDGQYPSLWITNGGGGTFVGLWTPSTFAQAGLYISDTSTPGRVYELSSEHHVRNEVVLNNVSNWQIYALQTEEESGEGAFALPLDIRDSSDITIANFHMYRVVSAYQPFPYAIKITNSKNINFRNVHCYSDSKASFDNVLHDETHNFDLRQRELAWLTISGNAPQPQPPQTSAIIAGGAQVEKLTGGFFNISGGAMDSSGNLYFVDARKQTIYRWSTAAHQLSVVRDNPLDPVQLFFDRSGDLMVISYAGDGTVYSFKPDAQDDDITLLKPQPAAARPGMTPTLPVSFWRNENDFVEAIPQRKPYQYVSPDGTTFLPAGEDFVSGELYYGTKLNDLLRAFGVGPAVPGQSFYVSDESEEKTYVAKVADDGTITDPKLFVEQGGESLATDDHGNVYIAAGEVYVYNPAGNLIATIDVPERPSQILFGGADHSTLFILARTSLYAVHTRFKGR